MLHHMESSISRAVLLRTMGAARDAIVITDPHGVIQWVNEAFTVLTGYGAGEAIGQTPRMLKSGRQDEACYRDLWETIQAGKVWRGELINRRKDGSTYVDEQTITPVHDEAGTVTHFIAVKRDVTRRRELEDELRRSHAELERRVQERTAELTEREARLSTILNLAPNAIITINDDQRITSFNRAAEQTFRYAAREVLGRPLDMLLPQRFSDVHRDHVRAFAGGPVTTRRMGEAGREYFGRRKDGAEFPIACDIARVDLPQGRCYTVILEDITEEKRLQEQVQRAEKLSAMGTFVAGFVHDVRNPLTSMSGFTELLLQREMEERDRQALQIVRDESQRALEITEDLLAFARDDAPEERALVSLNRIVEQVLQRRGHELRRDDIQVQTDLQEDPPHVLANAGQMQRVLLNLVMNAEQAMAEAHGYGTLLLRTWEAAGSVHLAVADDGPGILAENMKTLFDPFFTTKPKGEGTGLGLSVAYRIVQDHGGMLHVASQVGEGTTFRISLPAALEPDGE